MKLIINMVGLLGVLIISSLGSTQTIEKKGLTLEGAKKVIAAAVAEAKSKTRPASRSRWSTKEAISLRWSGLTIPLPPARTFRSARRGLRSCSNGPRSSSKT